MLVGLPNSGLFIGCICCYLEKGSEDLSNVGKEESLIGFSKARGLRRLAKANNNSREQNPKSMIEDRTSSH